MSRNTVILGALLCCIGSSLYALDATSLPPEQTVIGLEPIVPLPDAEESKYIVYAQVESKQKESFNWDDRFTSKVTISGKKVVFAPGHPNRLYEMYNGPNVCSIKEMTIYAEQLIIRDRLNLPQTNLTIYAKELRFEDQPGAQPACICTTPLDTTIRPARPADDGSWPPPPGSNGSPGLRAGNVTAYIGSFHADGNAGKRFILTGGTGQPAGLGHPGKAGEDGPFIQTWGGWNEYYAAHVTYYEIWGNYPYIGWIIDQSDGWKDKWPGDGQPGIAPGKPGNGGPAGYLAGTIDLKNFLDASGGVASPKAPDAAGGSAGQPDPALRLKNIRNGPWSVIASHDQVDGPATPGPAADIPVGPIGGFTLAGHGNSWVSPASLRQVLAHARDAYVDGYLGFVRNTLTDYVSLLDKYKASPQWVSLPDEWQLDLEQMYGEMQTLLHRIDSNLDYFGNPAGWVPMLSFEVQYLAFQQEIEEAIPVIYLSYWLEKSSVKLKDKINGLQTMRDMLQKEVAQFKTDYNTAVALVPELSTLSFSVSSKADALQAELQHLEKDLEARAEKNVKDKNKVPTWKKVCGVAGAICQVVPVYQPALRIVGAGLTVLSKYDDKNPEATLDQLTDVAAQFNKNTLSDSAKDWRTKIDTIELRVADKDVKQYAKNLLELAKPIKEGAASVKAAFQGTEVPKSAIDAELARMRAEDPAFNHVADKLDELMAQKQVLAAKLASTYQQINNLTDGITRDILAIDSANVALADSGGAFNERVLAYVRDMGQRARHRLQKYHYYLSKAYEYRMLERYSWSLRLEDWLDTLMALAEKSTSQALTEDQVKSFRALYEQQLSEVTAHILSRYNETPRNLSSWIDLDLTTEQLAALNAGQAVVLNLMDMGRFRATEEDLRIVDIQAGAIEVHPVGGSYGSWADLDIDILHSGVSRLRRDGETYLFQHFNSKNAKYPILWKARYDARSGHLENLPLSASTESLLKTLLSLNHAENQSPVLYSQPAGWADLSISKHVNTPNAVDIVVDRLQLKLQYDFLPAYGDSRLQVRMSSRELMPRVQVDTADKNGRQDADGEFTRIYPNYQTVTLTAPAQYGAYSFQRWTDNSGQTLSQEPQLRMELKGEAEVRVEYLNPDASSPGDSTPDDGNNGTPDDGGDSTPEKRIGCGRAGASPAEALGLTFLTVLMLSGMKYRVYSRRRA